MPDIQNPTATPSNAGDQPATSSGPTPINRPVAVDDVALRVNVYANLYIDSHTGLLELGARNYKTREAATDRATTHRIREGLVYLGAIPVVASLTQEQVDESRRQRTAAIERLREQAANGTADEGEGPADTLGHDDDGN